MFKKKTNHDDVEIVQLTHAHNNYELGLIKTLLKENGIPCLTKEEGSGQYMRIYTGRSLTGADILVAKPLLEKAKGLLESVGMSE